MFLVVLGGFWACLGVLEGSLELLVVNGGFVWFNYFFFLDCSWWFLVVLCGSFWFLMILLGSWWFFVVLCW